MSDDVGRGLVVPGDAERCPGARGAADRSVDAGADLVGPRLRVRVDGGLADGSWPDVPWPAEVLSRREWSGQLHWQDRNSFKRSGHRPDLVAWRGSSKFAIDVELAGKSRPRLDAILKLHDDWVLGGNTGGVIYICGDEEGQRRVERSANRVAPFGRRLRLELLDTIKEQTVAAYEASRSGCAAGASAAPAPMLGGHGG